MTGWWIAVAVAAAPEAQVGIHAAMADSAAGWNDGDLSRFVAIYADDAVFVTPKGLVRGGRAIADHYRASFAGGSNTRGRLTFSNERYRKLDARHELLWAQWTLAPAAGAKIETGMTTLVFERRADGWRIVSDHSS